MNDYKLFKEPKQMKCNISAANKALDFIKPPKILRKKDL